MMQSTSDTSNQSAPHSAPLKAIEPRTLTTKAIKFLQEAKDVKHHANLEHILQITRMRDLNEGKNGAAPAKTPEKKSKANIKFK